MRVGRTTRSKGRPKASEASDRAEELLGIATEVFLECGFERTRVSDIVKRAGASKRSIYSRYPTKEALFNAVISRRIEILDRKMDESLYSSHSISVLLENFGWNLFEVLLSSELRLLCKTVVSHSSVFPELAEKFWESGPENAIKNLGHILANNDEFFGDNPLQAAEVFVSLCLGTSLLKIQLIPNLVLSKQEICTRLEHIIHIFLLTYCTKK